MVTRWALTARGARDSLDGMTETTSLTRSIAGVEVHPIGLGEMPMSLRGRPDEDRSIRTIHAALDAGANLIDTADAYARDDRDIGHGERLVAKALKGLEPSTFCMASRRSSQLSYSRKRAVSIPALSRASRSYPRSRARLTWRSASVFSVRRTST